MKRGRYVGGFQRKPVHIHAEVSRRKEFLQSAMYFDGLTVEWKMSKAKTFLEASHSYTVKWETAMENVLERKYPVPHVLVLISLPVGMKGLSLLKSVASF